LRAIKRSTRSWICPAPDRRQGACGNGVQNRAGTEFIHIAARQEGDPMKTPTRSGKLRTVGTLLAAAASLAACAVDVGSAAPARELARAAQPAGSAYVGWRVYQARCAACHGDAAAGPAKVPGLLESVRGMGTRRFVNLVLYRYDWSVVGAADGDDEATRRSLVEDILKRNEQAFAMPAWQDEPPVSAHVLDLYAYLSARADGALGTGRPPR
jgi:cytochrome c2